MKTYVLLSALALLLAGCDTAFDPFEEASVAGALYAVLSADQARQVVRVESVVVPGSPPPDVAVLLVEEGGDTLGLRPQFGGLPGSAAFAAPERARAGATYRVEATVTPLRGEARTLVGRITVPPRFDARVDSAVVDTAFGLSQTLVWLGLEDRPPGLLVTYTFARLDGTRSVRLSEAYGAGRQAPGGYAYDVRLGRDLRRLVPDATRILNVGTDSLRVLRANAEIVAVSRGSVEGGPGELGATATSRFEWQPPNEALAAALGR